MTYRNILAAMGAAAALWLGSPGASAQINLPTAAGYLDRAMAMTADNNARGTIDQALRSLALYPSASQSEEASFLRAVAALRERDADAPRLLDGFAAAYPESPRALPARVAAADWFFAKGDYPAALARYAVLSPQGLNAADEAALRYHTAFCRLLMAEYDKAAEGFQAVADSKAAGEYGPGAVFYLGYIDYRRGDNDAALRRFAAAAKADAAKADADIAGAAEAYTAQIYYSRGDNEKALAAARRSLKSPQGAFHPEARRIAGESLYNLGRADEAVPMLWVYAQAVENPAPTALYILGTDEFRKGNYKEAATLLGRAASDPSAMGQSASLMLGHAYLADKRLDAAIMAFERAMNADYDPAIAESAAYNHAVAGIDGGHAPFASSVTALEAFLDKYPQSTLAPKVEEYIVNGYMTDRNYEAALASIDRLKHPSDRIRAARQRVTYALGAREYGEGKYPQALTHLKQAASLTAAPFDASIARSARLWQGLTELALDRPAEAAATLRAYVDTASKNDPELPVACYNLGYAFWDEEKYSDAADAFARVGADKAVAPRLRSDALARVADALYHDSDFAAAARKYAEALELNPDAADYAMFQQAQMLGLQRDHRAKIALLDEFAEKFPSSALRPDALLEKAESQVAIGDNDAAILTYETLTDLYPAAATARQGRLRMAVTRANAGQTDRAIDDYRALVEAYPTSPEARMAIDDLKQIYSDRGDVATLTSWLASVKDAPELDPSEIERLAFVAAEKEYMEKDRTDRLSKYISDYPQGANLPRAIYYMAEAAAISDNIPEAYRYAEMLLSRYPDSDAAPDALLIRADAEAAQGKTESALASYTALADRAANPSQLARARTGILRAATDLGHNDEALTAADQILGSTAAGSKDRNEVMMLRGLALDRLGRHEEAYAQWEELIAAHPDDINAARASVARSASMLRRGQTDNAHRAIDKFINSNPPSQYWLARAFILLSDILRAEGNDFEAQEYLRSLQNNYPGDEKDIIEMINSRLAK